MQIEQCIEQLRQGATGLSPAKFAHIVCLTARFAEMRQWYIIVLNATVAFENERLCFLRYDDEHHRIGLVYQDDLAPLPEAPISSVHHFSFTYRTLPELLGTYVRLNDAGIKPFWPVNHGPTSSIYYKDPDGHRVELQYDNFTDGESERFFAEGNYKENPIGVIFDPEDWIRRYSEGEPINSIIRRPKLPDGVSPFDMIRF